MKIRDVLLSAYGKASSIPSPVNRLMTDFAGRFFETDVMLISA